MNANNKCVDHRRGASRLGRRRATLLVALAAIGCPQAGDGAPPIADEKRHLVARRVMVERQIRARGVKDRRVLAAMLAVKRHLYVPPHLASRAYADHPLPIGKGQTISQPYIVAFMTEALRLKPGARVLEIGTGSGYQAAVLARVARRVYSIEIVPELGRRARKLLGRRGYRNVEVRVGDGYAGWPAKAPFDAVILTAAPPQIPAPLIAQLKVGGVLVAPVGRGAQELVRLTRVSDKKIKRERLLGVRFVPMTGKAQGR